MADNRPIVIKKVKKVSGGGHHGGAWKVAYADFVTAMMAFFLLMWLINTTSPDQKRGIADYFAPASVSKSRQGSDGMLGGTSFQDDGARSGGTNRPMPESKQTASKRRTSTKNAGTPSNETNKSKEVSQSAMSKAIAMREQAEFERAEQSLRQAMQDMPDLAALSKHLVIDQTPEGMRIQIVDQEGRAMFAAASAKPLPRAEKILAAVSQVIMKLPNRVSISGHTGDLPTGVEGYSNWQLSSDRANSARSILESSGLDADRIYQVSGKAGSEPLYPDDPDLPGNRRISIVLLRESPVLPSNHSL
ncbi:flagellar motor protein MotB [Hirschia baltica]|uniref:OmpA/MotB domain protein n=1 Tax=Hirschia baltica (strain ATCC 49814 / DSM 5838 / IFAM 1418) TaxID=582402 RepID=C6XIV2_HIRBI|nr:flagellar motor protein MotB [Hirschia baltica]ACT59047.1 OmpA/MotB domain protein [Hirschia baltica ATCC 49814]